MSYIKKTTKIIWYGIINNRVLFGLTFLIYGVFAPAITLINIGDYRYGHGFSLDPRESLVMIFGAALAYFGGFFFPMGLFTYVQNRRKCDFYSSMPVKRSQYFWGYFLSGIVVFTVCYGYFLLTHFVIFGFYPNVFYHVWRHYATFFIIYCSMILSVCFSGSVVSSIITFLLRNSISIVLIAFLISISGVDAYSYWKFFEVYGAASAPIFSVMNIYSDYYDIVVIQLIIALAELIIAFFFHKFRKSESTMAVAFPKSRYPFQYIVMLVITLAADLFLYALLANVHDQEMNRKLFDDTSLLKFIFFTLIIVLISFIILNIILEKNSRAAFSKIRHFFIFCGSYALIFALLFYVAAPALPEEILPFKPDYAVIREYTAYISYVGEEVNEDGMISCSYNVIPTDKAYILTDKERIDELSHMAQAASRNKGEIVFDSNMHYLSYSADEKEGIKRYAVTFVKGELPDMDKQSLSVLDLREVSLFRDNCVLRFCLADSQSAMDPYLERGLEDANTLDSYMIQGEFWIEASEAGKMKILQNRGN